MAMRQKAVTPIGPLRGMQKGMITQALVITVMLIAIAGGSLIAVACEQPSDIIGFLMLGVLSIIAAITYTVGTKPYGHLRLGDVSVLVFFGWLSVAGTYYLQTHSFNNVVMLPATTSGLLATAVLNINNLRDIDSDRANGKNTLAVQLGPQRARVYHVLLLSSAVLCTVHPVQSAQSVGLAVLLAIPLLVCHAMRVLRDPTRVGMRPMQIPMKYDTSELCNIYHEEVNVVEPLFSNFGGRTSFGGQITTVKCFEDSGLLFDLLEENSRGRVLLIDGGGSARCALINAELARLATLNEWKGIVVYGAVRQVDDLEELDIGIQAMAAIPVGAV